MTTTDAVPAVTAAPAAPAVTVAEFISFLHQPVAGLIELRLIQEPKPKGAKARVMPVFFTALSDVEKFALERIPALQEARGMAVHLGVVPRRVRKYENGCGGHQDDCQQTATLWADLDFKAYAGGEQEARARLAEFQLEPSIIVETGGGLHAYWKLGEPVNAGSAVDSPAKQLMLRLHTALGSDTSVSEAARVLRLPGTLNLKLPGEPRRVRVIAWRPERVYVPGDFSVLPLPERAKPSTPALPAREHAPAAGQADRYAEAAFAKQIGALALAQAGTLHKQTFLSAVNIGEFVGAGRLDRGIVEDALFRAAVAAGRQDLDDTRIAIRDGLDRGSMHPNVTKMPKATTDASGSSAASPAQQVAIDTSVAHTDADGKLCIVLGDEVELGTYLLEQLRGEGPPLRHDAGELYRYRADAGVWDAISEVEQSAIIQRLSGTLLPGGEHPKPLKLSSRTVYGALSLAHDRSHSADFFRGATPGMAFTNGFVAVTSTGIKLLEHSPDNRARFALPVEFKFDAESPQFYDFLASTLGDDDDALARIQLLQEYVGVTLLGRVTDFAVALVLIGSGANGKSTMLEIISALFPRHAIAAVPPQAWDNEFSVAHLIGKRLNVVSELPEANIIASETFKSIIAGDLKSIRKPYARHSLDFHAEAGHIFAANRLPGTDDITEAFWRRFILIPFTRVIPPEARIQGLARKLVEAELAGIALWAIRGAQRLLASGQFTIPESSQIALREWRINADPIARWLDESARRVDARNEFMQASILFEDFKLWADTNCHRRMSSTKFGRRLKELGIDSFRGESGTFYAVQLSAGGDGKAHRSDD